MISPIHRILVAVDAFTEDITIPQSRVLPRVSDMMSAYGAEVNLVHVLTPSTARVPENEFAKWSTYYGDHARKNLDELKAKLGGAEKKVSTHVLVEPSSSIRDAVDRLLQFAIEDKADLVVVQTHGRSAPERFFFGSFAETLVLRSRIATLVINPDAEARPLFEEIVLASDLSERSRKVFDFAVDMAKSTKARLTLFSRVPSPYTFLAPPGILAYQALDRACREHREIACHWAEGASQRGVQTQSDVCELSGSLSDAIISHAKENSASLIVVGNQVANRGLFSAGRIARQVARQATAPVLILPIQGLAGMT